MYPNEVARRPFRVLNGSWILRLTRVLRRFESQADIRMYVKTARAVQAVLSFSPCHPFERGNLSEENCLWLSRASKHLGAWSQIRNNARLRSDLRTLTDPKMPGHRCLPSDAHKILKHGRTRNTDLGDYHTTTA